MEPSQLFLSLFLSVMGAAYFVYGKKKPSLSFLISGVIMSFFGYFVETLWLTLLIAVVLCASPFYIQFED